MEDKSSQMKKKAAFDDLFVLIIVGFIFAIFIIICSMLIHKTNTAYQDMDAIPASAKTMIANSSNTYDTLFNGIFMTIFLTLAIGSIILASQIDANPIFFPISIIIYVILIIISAVFGNAYYSVASNPEMVTYAENFPIITFIFNHLVQIILGIGILLGMVLYAKTRD